MDILTFSLAAASLRLLVHGGVFSRTILARQSPRSRGVFNTSHAAVRLLIAVAILGCMPAQAATKGILIYSDYGTMTPYTIEFETISWQSGADGTIKKPNGKYDQFQNDWIQKIVYFDRGYFTAIDASPDIRPMRDRIRNREIVVDGDPKNLATPDEAKRSAGEISTLEALKTSFPISAPQVGTVLDSIRRQLARYQRGELKREGHWLTAAEVASLKALESRTKRTFSFTDKNGKNYHDVTLGTVAADEFGVIVDEGIEHVRFTDLPDDIRGLPPEVKGPVQKLRDIATKASLEEQRIAKAKEQEIAKQLAMEKEQADRQHAMEQEQGVQKRAAEQPRSASFGSNETECRDVYGAPSREVPALAPATKAAAHAHGGFDMVIGYLDGKATYFSFTKGNEPLNSTEIDSLLKTHNGNSDWKRVSGTPSPIDGRWLDEWTRKDGKARAELLHIEKRSILSVYGESY